MPDQPLILASASVVRLQLLQNAGLAVVAQPARVDEVAAREAMAHEQAKPRDVADALAEMKAMKVARSHPTGLVLGCDQTLALDNTILSKPLDKGDARTQLLALRGRSHELHSAIVLFHEGRPVWRHLGSAKLTMRSFTDTYLDAYLERNWPEVSGSVGSYMLEGEGIRLFSEIEGDYFSILGLPLVPLLSYLCLRGFIES